MKSIFGGINKAMTKNNNNKSSIRYHPVMFKFLYFYNFLYPAAVCESLGKNNLVFNLKIIICPNSRMLNVYVTEKWKNNFQI